MKFFTRRESTPDKESTTRNTATIKGPGSQALCPARRQFAAEPIEVGYLADVSLEGILKKLAALRSSRSSSWRVLARRYRAGLRDIYGDQPDCRRLVRTCLRPHRSLHRSGRRGRSRGEFRGARQDGCGARVPRLRLGTPVPERCGHNIPMFDARHSRAGGSIGELGNVGLIAGTKKGPGTRCSAPSGPATVHLLSPRRGH
jgi:hypothetical protein